VRHISDLSEATLGARIKEARLAAGLRQGDLATAVGSVDQTWVSRVESGSSLSTLQLQRIAKLTGRPIEFFLRPDVPAGRPNLRTSDASSPATHQAVAWADRLYENYERLLDLSR
jgi:transcriptional regulator with XRE-family HTH domain